MCSSVDLICAVQVHVLCYTVFVLLKNLLPVLKPGDLSICRKSLQDVSIFIEWPLYKPLACKH